MSHIAVWTDSSERVQRKHYHPDEVDTAGAHEADSSGSPPDVEPWVRVTEYYNPTDGFYYTTEDPMADSPLSDEQKQEMYDAFTSNDISKAREIVENALNQ